MNENTESLPNVSTRSVGLKYGLISAIAGIALFLVSVILGQNPFQGVWNWIAIAVTIVLLFLAHKNYKDSKDGFMSYGQGVGIGFWFTLVSTLLGVGAMYGYLSFIDSSPMDLFYEEQRAGMEEAGQSEEAIDIALEWTRKLFWVFALVGSIFWGMIIALILSIFTQKKAPEQAF